MIGKLFILALHVLQISRNVLTLIIEKVQGASNNTFLLMGIFYLEKIQNVFWGGTLRLDIIEVGDMNKFLVISSSFSCLPLFDEKYSTSKCLRQKKFNFAFFMV